MKINWTPINHNLFYKLEVILSNNLASAKKTWGDDWREVSKLAARQAVADISREMCGLPTKGKDTVSAASVIRSPEGKEVLAVITLATTNIEESSGNSRRYLNIVSYVCAPEDKSRLYKAINPDPAILH